MQLLCIVWQNAIKEQDRKQQCQKITTEINN